MKRLPRATTALAVAAILCAGTAAPATADHVLPARDVLAVVEK